MSIPPDFASPTSSPVPPSPVQTTPVSRPSPYAAAGADDSRRKRRVSRSIGDKNGKGLRHFSLKVCEKVESKGRTTYNEVNTLTQSEAATKNGRGQADVAMTSGHIVVQVADELVEEFSSENGGPQQQGTDQHQHYDEKNIRRRVYDALNVLMAMDIIGKENKDIFWRGLPSAAVSLADQLQTEKAMMKGRVEKKEELLQELKEQVEGLQKLVSRNQSLAKGGPPSTNGVQLPFILVQTRPEATVEVMIAPDMQLVHFDFNCTPFELHDDSYVLKALGLQGGKAGGGAGSTPFTGPLRPHSTRIRPREGPAILKSRVKAEVQR